MANQRNLKLPIYLQFLKTILSFPGKVVANFNKKHLKTLFYALQHEPLHVILYNLKNLLFHSDALQQYRVRDHQKGFCLEIERIRFFEGKLTIKGWCATKETIGGFLALTDQHIQLQPTINLFRPDVGEHLSEYPNSANSGFFLVGNISGETKAITFNIRLENGEERVVEIDLEVDTWAKQYQQFLAKKQTDLPINKSLDLSSTIEIIQLNATLDAVNLANKAANSSTSTYCLFVAPYVTLSDDALIYFQRAIAQNPTASIIYSDEVRLNKKGEQIPYFKSDFNFDLLLSTNYIGNTFLVKKDFGEKFGWFDEKLTTAFCYDFLLRSMEQKGIICHLPKLLVSYQEIQEINNKKVIEKYIGRNKISATIAADSATNQWRIQREIAIAASTQSAGSNDQLVSIIIPFRDNVNLLKTCIKSIIEKTDYKNYEILLIDNNSEAEETANYLKEITAQQDFINSYSFKEPFNFSKINNWAVQFAKGNFLLFLNNDTEIIEKGWLTEMLSQCQRPEVGAVGAKLLYPDNTIQHAGIILGIFGVAEHSHKYFHDGAKGYFDRPNLLQNVTAVTGACLMTKKSDFQSVNGFDETAFPITLNDVDFCLKLRANGQLIVYTPFAKLYHYESKSRGAESTHDKKSRAMQEIKTFRQKWAKEIAQGDPYYNPNLSYYSTDYQLNVAANSFAEGCK